MLKIIPAQDTAAWKERLARRAQARHPEEEHLVRRILEAVEHEGDEALFSYTRKFDDFDITTENIRVSEQEIEQAYSEVPKEVRQLLVEAAANIEAFHRHQKRENWFIERPDGSFLGQLYIPVATAAVYVPGGTAAYPSSVLMNIVPAKCAGVETVCVGTPARGGSINPVTVVAAHVAGADAIYKIGGAQAVAAFAFGTASVPKADVIAGPGNIYVALAKRLLYGRVGIDMIAGPSEICILADGKAAAGLAAADLLSQAEHDVLAASVLVTDSADLARAVDKEVEQQLSTLPRRDIARSSLESFGTVIVCDDLDEGVRVVNAIAPEHLEVLTADPEKLLFDIRNAGSIFLGPYSPEPLGDYFAGTNHVLPTNGTARFASPLNVDNFQKKSSVIYFTREAMAQEAAKIALFARTEGLEAHARSAELRSAAPSEPQPESCD
ncbi:MAG: histidinol dehydrogenase [Clostridia bacterium]|nr:histidinol dehydrogenase [Clostridia bacterium]